MTGHDELEDGREQLLVVQSLVPVPSRDQAAHEVVAGCVAFGLDQPAQLRHDGVGRLLGPGVVGRGRRGNEHGDEPSAERGALSFGHAEQLADDGEREREGERGHQIDRRVGVAGRPGRRAGRPRWPGPAAARLSTLLVEKADDTRRRNRV